MSHSHGHSHGHDHDHSGLFHTHAPAGKMKQAFFLAMIILIAELVFGLLSNSLALLADAWHMATDVLAIGLSWFALVQAKKPANKEMTFGYERAGILAAAVNGLTLVVITFWILYSAISRILHPEHVGGMGMLIGAGIGVVINLIIIFALNGEGENLNVKATLLHVIGDLGASVGVIIAAILIHFTGLEIIDPILSILIALIVAFSAWNIIKKSFSILMEATPKGIHLDEIATTIKNVPGIKSVHDLHIWTLTGDRNFLTCHAVIEEGIPMSDSHQLLTKINQELCKSGIQHSTIQLEDGMTTHADDLICKESGGHGHAHGHGHDHDHSHDHHH
ncbi:MAG TPA: cation diffusion facilitator family transporter [Sporolactobacillaceae bacterium]|nr:cation diffusion facilitator family transporter [Sporolactobacillaceae bacterium]